MSVASFIFTWFILIICSSIIRAGPHFIDNDEKLKSELESIENVTHKIIHQANEPCNKERESDSILLEKLLLRHNLLLRKPQLRDDYVYTPDVGLHKLHTRPMNWNTARKICLQEGGHLAVINSKAEAQVLSEIFRKAGPMKGAPNDEEALIGIHDYYEEGEWVTVLDQSLAQTGFTNWSNKWGGQPDGSGENSNCGAFLVEGTLDDVSCDSTYPFFCELPFFNDI